MIIAVAQEGSSVSEHFGHCQSFALFDSSTGKWSITDNPGHQPGSLPKYLHDLKADVVIAGGMGARAQELMRQYGIQVVVGAHGLVPNVVESFLKGTLQSTGETCSHHEHQHECGGSCHD
ncbi:NifB/NifX family molybdenum-iron cluster-binding protein [Syntrophomonas palmitatica]|uniref:NifB/NifX family molybdenum-iron cluster-binding protein n=1 Tax=Syntrophomonas palmitatica TaxID=402877 RepID=UPI0006D2BC1B|nr:NifB/NifX family molybdenum-iron cluster-binding protein [Syntrophomonas palmitatica]